MTWLTWRQHRIEILIMGIILLLFAAVLLVTRMNIGAASEKLSACTSNQLADCSAAQGTLNNDINQIVLNPLFLVLSLSLPLLAGMFIGPYAIARELEQGTYRTIWTQGIPWYRWLVTKSSLITSVVLCAFGILFGLLSWWAFPITSALQENGNFTFTNRFDIWGIVTIAYALFALMLGIFAGTALRKTVPAMAITLVIFIAVRVLVATFWRPYFIPPIVVTTPAIFSATRPSIPPNAWRLSDEVVDRQGQPVAIDGLSGLPQVCSAVYTSITSSKPKGADMARYNRCIIDHGIQDRMVYQPVDRFWLFQGIESGIYLLMTAMLFALTFWWTKYRIIGA